MPAFLLPDLGEGLTEAEIVTWRVQAGDVVTVDQTVVEVETAKAVVEVPVPFAGRVTALHGEPGDVLAVGAPLITVAGADTEPDTAPAQDLAARHPAIGDVRGLGLMLALEFIQPGVGDGRVPDAGLAKRVLSEALDRHLIVLSAGTYANVARIIPPLVTTAAEIDQALAILDESITAAGA